MSNLETFMKHAAPLSNEQKNIWFTHAHYPSMPLFNATYLFRVEGKVNLAVLTRAIHHVVARHGGLTSRFGEKEGAPVQFPAPEGALDLVGHHGSVDGYAPALALIAEKTMLPFDLQNASSIRADLVQFAEDGYVVGLSVHQIVCDCWSAALFFDELSATYNEMLAGDPRTGSTQELSYLAYSHWQNEVEQLAIIEESNTYWQQYLKGVSPQLRLPLVQQRPQSFDFRGACDMLAIPDALHQSVAALGLQQKVTPYAIYLTAFSILMQRYTQQRDFCIAYPSANRSMPDAEGAIGLFTKLLVSRVNIGGEVRFIDALAATYDTLLDAYANESVTLGKVMEELGISGDGSYSPLFQIIFAQQGKTNEGLRLNQVSAERVSVPSGIAKTDLTIMLFLNDSDASAYVEYASSVFTAEEVAQVWRMFIQLLGSFCADSKQGIDQPMLDGIVALALDLAA